MRGPNVGSGGMCAICVAAFFRSYTNVMFRVAL